MAGIGNLASGYAPMNGISGGSGYTGVDYQNGTGAFAPGGAATSGGGFDSLLGATLGGTLNGISGIYGSQNAAEAQNHGILAGIGTQQQTMGNINSLFSGQAAAGNNAFSQLGTTNPFATQQGAGNNAFTQLGKLQGANGAAPDYSGFENSPGYKFALEQGQNAIRSQAAANGSAYTPNTLANIGKFVTGTASQNYNNYVNQLMQTAGLGAQGNSGQLSQMLGTAGLGAQANSGLSEANLKTGGNISQLQQNSGNAQASGMAGSSGAVGSLLQSLLGGVNGSGVLSAIGSGINGIGKLFGSGSGNNSGGIGNILNGAGSLFGGGTGSNGTPYSDYNAATGEGNYTNNSLFDQFSGSSGYDPSTGQYGDSQYSFDQFANQGGYDSSTGDWGGTNLGNISLGDFGNP